MTTQCDRCHKPLEVELDATITCGCYVGWVKFMDPGENVICDECMWSDPRYTAVYGGVSRASQ